MMELRQTTTAHYALALVNVKMTAVSELDSAGFCSALGSSRTLSLASVVANQREIILLHEHRPVAQLVRALP